MIVTDMESCERPFVHSEEPCAPPSSGYKHCEDSKPNHTELQPDIKPCIVRVHDLDTVFSIEGFEWFNPRRPVADPAPTKSGLLLRELGNFLPYLKPPGEITALAEQAKQRVSCKDGNDDAKGEKSRCGDVERGATSVPRRANHRGILGFAESLRPQREAERNHRDCERYGDGCGSRQRYEQNAQHDPKPATARFGFFRGELKPEDNEPEQRSETEQRTVAEEPLDRPALKQEVTAPHQEFQRFLIGARRIHPPDIHGVSHEDGYDQFEEERTQEQVAQRGGEGSEELVPAEGKRYKHGNKRGAQQDECSKQRFESVGGPRNRNDREAEECEERYWEIAPLERGGFDANEHPRCGCDESGAEDDECGPTNDVANRDTADGVDQNQNRKRAQRQPGLRLSHPCSVDACSFSSAILRASMPGGMLKRFRSCLVNHRLATRKQSCGWEHT